jgi:hypothetical protein
MRTLAQVDEGLGDLAEAAALYRLAPIGGGMCGTSTPYYRELQLKGTVRMAERQNACASVVRERLYGTDDSNFDYGPTRLAKAGWDVPRLYRAAILTRGRDAPNGETERLFAALPAELREPALERLKAKGAESFERELRAIPGLADAAGAQALPTLLPLARGGDVEPAARRAALGALAELADLPERDPCAPDEGTGFGFGSWSSDRPRQVRHVNHVCATKLGADEQRAIAEVFLLAAQDRSEIVREAAAHGVAQVLPASRAVPILRRLARDHEARPGWSRASPKGAVPIYAVADAAREELDKLARSEAASRGSKRR